jgi:formylmethanofuran--tetrahydromethanopterin N-formyltransferase
MIHCKKKQKDESQLEVIGYDVEDESFVVKTSIGESIHVSDTSAEIFHMWAGRILITAEDKNWAITAAKAATGFATSIIMSPAEAAVEKILPPEKTPDNLTGVLIQIYNRAIIGLKDQMIRRIEQCIMTCPTTAVYDALPEAEQRLKVGRSLSLFGDGFQRRDEIRGRKVWRIPVMEGEFIVEESFGAVQAVAGGTLILMGDSQKTCLLAAEKAVEAIHKNIEEVITPFPDGICRSGSKVGSMRYNLGASTNHLFCPVLRKTVPYSKVPESVECVYEIVINGLTLEAIKGAMTEGMKAAAQTSGLIKISTANFGGRLGQYKIRLKDVLSI